MSRKAAFCAATLLTVLAGALAAPPPDSDEVRKLMNRLLQQSDLVSVQNVATPDGFQEDHDPNTLQVVFLTDPNAKGRVSDDGEVVFIPIGADINLQNAMTEEAFRRKANRILQGRAMLQPH